MGAEAFSLGEILSDTFKMILDQQRSWANQKAISLDQHGYTLKLDDNLYQPLSPNTISEFRSGGGDEFGTGNQRGKMQALHSSSSLVCNVFEYWREQNADDIAIACGAERGISELRFEKANPTGLRGTAPHLDVQFTGPGKIPLAVESKFTEPYYHTTTSNFPKPYFNKYGLWNDFPRCERLARKIYEKQITFSRLDAAQLLKHILGLKKAFPSGFKLLYLWYEIPSPEAILHINEIQLFEEYVNTDVDFRHMTYQDLFKVIKKIPNTDEAYIAYLAERYFS